MSSHHGLLVHLYIILIIKACVIIMYVNALLYLLHTSVFISLCILLYIWYTAYSCTYYYINFKLLYVHTIIVYSLHHCIHQYITNKHTLNRVVNLTPGLCMSKIKIKRCTSLLVQLICSRKRVLHNLKFFAG